MTTATVMPRLTTRTTAPPDIVMPVTTLASAVAGASEVVLRFEPDDPRWDRVGPALTHFVDAARRAIGEPGSSIGAGETVAVVLRLRDLAGLARTTAGQAGRRRMATTEVEARLRSLEDVATDRSSTDRGM